MAVFFAGCTRTYNYGVYESVPTYGEPKTSRAVHRATMKPYSVSGRRYYPTVVSVGTVYRGVASWYGRDFHGRKTSNGEYYNMYALTAAHKTLPMNTMVKVTNLNNGRSVVVRINDRGPFVKNRIIDLSYAAAKRIGMAGRGTAPVMVEVLGFDSTISRLAGTKQEVMISGFAVQIGSFRRIQGARITKDRYSVVDGRYRSEIKKFYLDGVPLYRVWLKGFKSEAEARDFIDRGEFPGAFIVRE